MESNPTEHDIQAVADFVRKNTEEDFKQRMSMYDMAQGMFTAAHSYLLLCTIAKEWDDREGYKEEWKL